MKWFKHFSNAQHDVKIRRLIRKYGLRGYGLYFACVESIAYQLETESPTPDMEENARDIAEYFGEDSAYIEEVLHFCIYTLQLFELNEANGRLTCMKLLVHLDNTMSNNPQIKAIIDNFRQNPVQLKETSRNFNQIRLDKIRLDNNTCANTQDKDTSLDAIPFTTFWEMYSYKKNRLTSERKWNRLSAADRVACLKALPKYIESTPDKQFRKHPSTYLNNRSWEDEIITKGSIDITDTQILERLKSGGMPQTPEAVAFIREKGYKLDDILYKKTPILEAVNAN